MLADLENKLKLVQNKQIKQQEQLNEILLQFSELHLKQHCLSEPYLPKINLFTKVRIEVLAQIYVFLDIHSLLELRLINKTCQMQISQIIPILLGQLEQKIKDLIGLNNEIRAKVEQSFNNIEIQQNSQKIYQQLNSLNFKELHELKAMSRPPLMVINVLFYFCTLLDPTFNSDKDPWIIGRRLLMDPDCLKQFLYFDISRITEQQLIILQQIYELDPENVKKISLAIYNIYKLLKMITEFREQPYYIYKNQEKVIDEKQVKIIKEIGILQKLQDRSNQIL